MSSKPVIDDSTGLLQKGDFCVVDFPDRERPSWLCRVVACLPFDDTSTKNSMYECITPHGSSLITGASWVRAATPEEIDKLQMLERAVSLKAAPYRGLFKIRT